MGSASRAADYGVVGDLGVLVDIPEPWAAVLATTRAELGDPAAYSIPPHVTLLPPTTVDARGLARVEAHLARVAKGHRPFIMRLQGTGTFQPVTRVVFVALSSGAEQCAALERDIRTGPLAQELRFEYYPHVTVAHDVDDAALARAQVKLRDFEAQFTVTEFSLHQLAADGVWRLHGSFPLGG